MDTAPDHQLGDKEAMDEVTKILSGKRWSPDTLDSIAEVVGYTGREIKDIDEDEDEEAAS